jgi:thymidylate synthase (FAD)
MIIKRGHESVLEHHGFSVRFICDRGISHELVRHRIASFSQESTRYVGYKDAAEFIIPSWMDLEPVEFDAEDSIFICELWEGKSQADIWWMGSMIDAAIKYSCLLKENWRPEQARSILPNSLKTEIVMTANLREWRHFFKLRTSDAAHPDMRAITRPLLEGVKKTIPVVFEDL